MDIKKVSSLARLKLSAEEEAKIQKQLEMVCKHFEEIAQVDVTDIEPLVTPSEIEQNMREDQVEPWDGKEQALEAAPEVAGQLFKVPPVV